jgi:hypothetical protein
MPAYAIIAILNCNSSVMFTCLCRIEPPNSDRRTLFFFGEIYLPLLFTVKWLIHEKDLSSYFRIHNHNGSYVTVSDSNRKKCVFIIFCNYVFEVCTQSITFIRNDGCVVEVGINAPYSEYPISDSGLEACFRDSGFPLLVSVPLE